MHFHDVILPQFFPFSPVPGSEKENVSCTTAKSTSRDPGAWEDTPGLSVSCIPNPYLGSCS